MKKQTSPYEPNPLKGDPNLAPTLPEKPKEKGKPVTNQYRGEVSSENSNSPDLKGERPVPNSQDESKRKEGENDSSVDKTDLTGKQVDDYFADTSTNTGKEQLF